MERWATFDCYGTLVDWQAGIGAELTRLFGKSEAETLLLRYHALEPDVQRDTRLAYRDVLARTLSLLAAEAGEKLPAGEEDALARSLPSWPVFADAAPALAEARRRGWRLAILSNSDRDLIDASTGAIGIPFDYVVVAGEIGSYKPHPRHWEVFAAASEARHERHVHVAQSLFHDIDPAHLLGLRSVWINRLGEPADPRPTRVLPDLAELPDTLEKLVSA